LRAAPTWALSFVAHPRSYFDGRYAESDDPWEFETSWYEQRKYALTLAVLPKTRYRYAVEPGCSNGVLTRLLAPRCDRLVAFDFVPMIVEAARRRVEGMGNVSVLNQEYPHFWPAGRGDLVVWSEVAYYLTSDDADVAIDGLARWLEPGGHLLSVHYTGVTDYPRAGREIMPWLDAQDFLRRAVTITDDEFELGVWERREFATVAATSPHVL
jgi:SAM-dependent methyltransferase